MDKAVVYGIPNCDIIKKTLEWLKKNDVPFEFHDYRKAGIEKARLVYWIKKAGLGSVFNKRSTTWKGLPGWEQEKMNGVEPAIDLMMKHNSIIKRPVIEKAGEVLVGYDELSLRKLFPGHNKK